MGTGESTTTEAATETESARARATRGLDRVGGRRIALYLVLLALIVLYLSPLWSGFTTSLKTAAGFATTTPITPPLPEYVTTEAWLEAWGRMRFAMVNSLVFVLPATVLSAFLGSLAAYGLTKIDWRGQIAILLLFLIGVFIPYQSVLVPLRQFWTIVDLPSLLAFSSTLAARSDLIALAITHTAYGIPICTILFRGYYLTIDDDIVEAAKLDGASSIRIYRRIILPLSKPMFAVTLIYQFTNIWNDLLFALVLVRTSRNFVATQALNELQGAMVGQYNLQMAGAFIVALPTLIIYVVFGSQFAKGLSGESGG
ncbi:carbohydrate ABC transporter permease [Halobacteria archaeon AArc-m2/3/4]|uniref:Carbohydrate ABC transporter permease n=1 Tax=Natronoglomus mannanivorans TaxID=2979990 RepID=A0ABT2Q8X6_9EURY|nr:carbohydrate ABC transporter permease [Halobacteria archaeon AArc-m2/3/4]